MEPTIAGQNSLNILMASGVPKRREGGVAAIIYNLGREIEALGHRVTYVFQEDLVAPGSVSARFTELIFSIRLSRYIAANRGNFSLVNLHAPVGFPYGIRRRWRRSANYPPYVMTLHGLEERRVHVMSREAKKGRASNFTWKNRLWHRFYHEPRFRWSIQTSDGAHAYSRDVWTMLQLKYNLDSDRVAYIANGVEPRFFIPRDYRPGEAMRLLYAGTWLEQRGIYYLREALRNVAQRIPGLTMTIAGGGVPKEEIRQFLGSELDGRIVVREVVPAQEMPNLYAEHDIFLFPSLMEGLPSVLLEAMAAGMPAITTETCGMPDVVENETNGLLIAPGSAAAIEDAVMTLAKSPDLRERLGKAARATMKHFTWEQSARQLEALFRHVLAFESQKSA
jgi:glycosyltransferase involved in cell wall biosynthesis